MFCAASDAFHPSPSQPLATTSTRVRPLFERQNSVTCNHPEKLSLTTVTESGKAVASSYDCLFEIEALTVVIYLLNTVI